ncbi:MAG: energy transducer TonB [Gammaproteobacteria bacterium]|nr:energy transducer TonB [Gammaproteobacteria bacterium]MCP4090545.1 energy transducer TonB [Gammaproteobacteria bacterium]MCP4276590.1 energy transducer TonB [Gammaproteobacteria bacterium]MCP4831344.1 energy transducer TonB [Gammaproteobacteria bacterium]MCP4928724.1 energy transducer TonB [Gammaproteobacteria bacterium]
MLARYSISFITGVFVTFCLLWIMQVLIATGKKALVDEDGFTLGDFIRVKVDEVVRQDEDDPEPPPEVEEPPPEMPEVAADELDTSQNISMGGPNGRINFNLVGGRIGLGDGDFLPIVKVAPIYPRRAQTRGLEGQCLIEFTVTSTGTTKDAFAVECTSSLFQKASVNAALKFKYKPRVVDGVAMDVPGVQHIITFKLED